MASEHLNSIPNEYCWVKYDGEITYVDEKVGELLHTLDEVGIIDDTLVILTADHGEILGEHHFYFDHAGRVWIHNSCSTNH